MELIVILMVLGAIPGMIAKSKGRGFFGWWIYGMVIFIIALPHSIIISSKAVKGDADVF